jgi:Ca-activated chloride channel homolog
MKTSLFLEHETDPTGITVRALLRVEGEPPAAEGRTPLNLSLVLDRSGSMMGEPLEAAKEAAANLLKRLWPEDVASVVAYDDEVRIVAEPATGADQAHLPAQVRGIGPGGSTNLSGGWLQGRDLVARHLRDGGVNRIVLLTDGHANAGIVDPDRLAGLCRKAAEGGITTTTVGFGTGFDERLLQAMSDAGGGSTYYIERADQASGVFEEEMEGLLSLSAQNLAVTVRTAPSTSVATVHHSYPASQLPDGGLGLHLGDLYAREPKSLLAEFRVTGAGAGTDEVEIARFELSAHVLSADGDVERQEITLPIRFTPAEGVHTDPEVRRELLLIGAGKAREEALEAERRGDFDGGAGKLREAARALREHDAGDERMQEEAADLEAMAERYRHHRVEEADRKYMHQRAYAASRDHYRSVERIRREPGQPPRQPDDDADGDRPKA